MKFLLYLLKPSSWKPEVNVQACHCWIFPECCKIQRRLCSLSLHRTHRTIWEEFLLHVLFIFIFHIYYRLCGSKSETLYHWSPSEGSIQQKRNLKRQWIWDTLWRQMSQRVHKTNTRCLPTNTTVFTVTADDLNFPTDRLNANNIRIPSLYPQQNLFHVQLIT